MKRTLILVTIAFATTVGTAALLTVHPQPARAALQAADAPSGMTRKLATPPAPIPRADRRQDNGGDRSPLVCACVLWQQGDVQTC